LIMSYWKECLHPNSKFWLYRPGRKCAVYLC
jgi:hypothetical protein